MCRALTDSPHHRASNSILSRDWTSLTTRICRNDCESGDSAQPIIQPLLDVGAHFLLPLVAASTYSSSREGFNTSTPPPPTSLPLRHLGSVSHGLFSSKVLRSHESQQQASSGQVTVQIEDSLPLPLLPLLLLLLLSSIFCFVFSFLLFLLLLPLLLLLLFLLLLALDGP